MNKTLAEWYWDNPESIPDDEYLGGFKVESTIEKLQRIHDEAFEAQLITSDAWQAADKAAYEAESAYNKAARALTKAKAQENL
jgi:hypothetical protein